jgi:hypothetical protein
LHALPRRSISVRFTPVSGIDSRSQALPGRAKTGREQMQQIEVRGRDASYHMETLNQFPKNRRREVCVS